MNWHGLSSAELCTMFKDQSRNGGRDLDALVKHVDNEPLVLWGWDPGDGRASVPLLHSELVAVMRVWIAAGAACPK